MSKPKRRGRKPLKSTRMRVTFSLDADIYKTFRRTCRVLDTNSSRIVDQYMMQFIEEYPINK